MATPCFFGEYQQVMDSKNRVFIPSKHRDIIGDHAYITCNVDKCLSIYSEEGWDEYTQLLRSLPKTESAKLQRFVFSSAIDAKLDSQGRVVLTPMLRDFAGLKKDIYIIGAGDHAEIWDKERRDGEMTEESMSELFSLLQRYNL